MAEKYELAYVDYKAGMKQKEIAAKYDVSINTVKSWQQRKWKEMDVEGANEKVCTPKESTHTEKDKGMHTEENEQSAVKSKRYPNGHPGNPNPVKKFTERNQAAVKHGLFSRYIPQETLEIMGMLDDKSPADLIWDQIQIQYAAIIRAQSIMFVSDKNEMIKELSKFKPGEFGDEKEWEFQFAWERQAQFLNAQSRAISELRTAIKQFVSMAAEDDERRVKLEQMRANVAKTKEETIRIQKLNEAGNQQNTEQKLEEYFTALQGAFTNEPTNE